MNNPEYRLHGSALASPAREGAEGARLLEQEPIEQRPPLLTHLLSTLRRRKWVIIGSVLIALLLGLVVTLLMTQQYTASSTIEIQRETSNVVEEARNETKTNVVDQEFYQTQYGLLEAQSLAQRVATDLRLFDNRAFFETFGARETEAWFDGTRPRPNVSTRDERVRLAGEILLDNFEVVPERMSRLVEIRFTSPDAELSKRIIDAWGASFIQSTLERRFDASSYARRFLEERLAQLRLRIDESERLLVDYAAREGIVNLPATTPAAGESGVTGERSLVADDLATLNRELSRAAADRIAAQSRLGATGDIVREGLENQAIGRLRERRAELAAEYARMMVQFEPNYPPARALQTQVQQLDRSITREESRVQGSLRETYQAATQREQALQERVDQLKSGVLDLRRRSIQYNIYQRDTDTNRELYNALLQRYKEIGIAGGIGVNNISIVDPAELPQRPSSPKLPLNMALALLAGLAVGASVAFALEQMDQGFADPTEIETNLGVALLGTIPKVVDGSADNAIEDPKSPFTEAYLSLKTSLSFTTDHGVPKTIGVTSTRPGEGKTTTSYAIATLLARSKRKVLLVDSDLRSPSIHHMVGIQNKMGLSNYLAGEDLTGLTVPTQQEGLFVMTAGPQPPSAPELLSGERLGRLLTELLQSFDHVIFDAPPVMGLADAPLICSRVEGTIFVVESHGTQKGMARVAINRLHNADAQLVGAVLTKFDSKRAHYGYGYEYGYGYGYGEAATKSAS